MDDDAHAAVDAAMNFESPIFNGYHDDLEERSARFFAAWKVRRLAGIARPAMAKSSTITVDDVFDDVFSGRFGQLVLQLQDDAKMPKPPAKRGFFPCIMQSLA